MQIEWASNGLEIEIEISPTGPAQILIVEPSGEESEMPAFSGSTDVWEQLHHRIATMGRASQNSRPLSHRNSTSGLSPIPFWTTPHTPS